MDQPTQKTAIDSSVVSGSDMLLPVNEPAQDVDVRFGYRIGTHHFVLDKSLLTELVIKPVIYPIPQSPPWLNGVINLRGTVVPVVDLSQSLNTVFYNSPGEYVLVIDKGVEALALLVDTPPASLTNPAPQTTTVVPHSIKPEFTSAGVQSDQMSWMQLDVKGLVLSLRTDS